jgi:cyclopropane fatty-acyl-phospholipid synthase-like methyltransferase
MITMKDDRSIFDDAYRKHEGYFGEGPERLLIDHVHLIDSTRPALDVGAGQGRNALYLAQKGIAVDAIDPSEEAVRAAASAARDNNLAVQAILSFYETFDPRAEREHFSTYGAICLFGLIQLLTWDSIGLLRDRVGLWSGKGTVVFLKAFTTEDSAFEKCARGWRSIGKNCFEDGSNNIRTFLEPDEAPGLFRGFSVVYHWEGLGPEHRHGDGPIQQHAVVELVLQR